jgi:hypothetical protein
VQFVVGFEGTSFIYWFQRTSLKPLFAKFGGISNSGAYL